MSGIVLFTDLLDDILLEVPTCPTVIAQNALAKAARDWYRDTYAWRERLPTFTTEPGVTAYLITPPRCATILAMDTLLDDKGKPFSNNSWVFEPSREITFEDEPQEGQTLTPKAVLQPSFGAQGVPCDHAPRWVNDWTHGALWYLRLQVGTPWYSPQDAENHRNLFRLSIGSTRNALNTGNRTGDMRVKPQPFN